MRKVTVIVAIRTWALAKIITGQTFEQFGREAVRHNACRCEGVVTGKRVRGRFDGDEAACHEPFNVLRGLFAQVPIKRVRAAHESRPIMSAERLDDETTRHRDSSISSR